MNDTRTIYKAQKVKTGPSFYIKHVPCGGQVAVEGTVTYRPPTGFGFRGSTFVVERACFKGWQGFCLSCKASGAFFVEPKTA
jgi:hypothetical protein